MSTLCTHDVAKCVYVCVCVSVSKMSLLFHLVIFVLLFSLAMHLYSLLCNRHNQNSGTVINLVIRYVH